MLTIPGRPLAIIELAWADVYCAVWFFDAQLRRVFQVDCRRLAEGRLFVNGGREWMYTKPGQAEFDEQVTWGEYGGGRSQSVYIGSAGPEPPLTHRLVQPESHWIDAPEFEGWGEFIRAFPEHLAALGYEISPTVITDDASSRDGEGLPIDARPWHPPRPLQPQPAQLDLLFSPGAQLVVGENEPVDGIGGTVVVEVHKVGMLRMPSGGLVACDPSWMHPDRRMHAVTYQPFTATVAPGKYPVLLSVFRWIVGNGPVEAAAKVIVRNEPVVSWEMGLRPEEDLRTLADGEFFGFGVDAAVGCFFDAIAASAMARLARDITFAYPRTEWTEERSDPESGANLIAFHTGWGDGSYPTWVGRAASGDVVCFIADMQLYEKVDPAPGTSHQG